MRAVRYHQHGDTDTLEIEDVPGPEPKSDEVVVEVHACSVNPVDVYLREGRTHMPAGLPATPGSDFAGVVTTVGDRVTDFEPGQRVLGAGLAFSRSGPYAEFVAAPVNQVAPLPGGVPFEVGAAVGHVGITAWCAVINLGAPHPLDTVLIHGGSGGVGHLAVQLARTVGARVIATAGSDERRRRVEALGAEVALDYVRDDLGEAIAEAADGGIDVVIDHRPGEYLELDIDLAADGGRIVLIDGYEVHVRNLRKTRRKDLTISNIGALSPGRDFTAILGKLGGLLAGGELKVTVDRTYPLEEVAEAHRALVEESFFGKIVLVP